MKFELYFEKLDGDSGTFWGGWGAHIDSRLRESKWFSSAQFGIWFTWFNIALTTFSLPEYEARWRAVRSE